MTPSADAPAAIARPEWLPEAHWDTTANTIKPEFGQHYSELKSFQETEAARIAAIPQKAEDYKLDPIIPEGIQIPEGMEVKIDPKDPVVVSMLALAVKHKVPQQVVNDWIADDIKMKVANHTTEMTRIAAEDQKLGANAEARKAAAGNWLKGMKDRGEITSEEYEEGRYTAINAHGVTLLEKLMAKASGTVPGHNPGNPPPPAQVPQAERWYGATTPKKVS